MKSTLIILFATITWINLPVLGQSLNFEPLSSKNGLPATECYNIIQDQEGYIWVFTEYGIVKHNGENFKPVCTNIALKDQNAYAVFKTESGELYFANSGSKIYRVRNDSAFSIRPIEEFTRNFNQPEDVIFQIIVDTNQDIYFSNYASSFHYSDQNKTISKLDNSFTHDLSGMHYQEINGKYFSLRGQDNRNSDVTLYIHEKEKTRDSDQGTKNQQKWITQKTINSLPLICQ